MLRQILIGLFLVLGFYSAAAQAQSKGSALSILCTKDSHLKGSTSTSIQVDLQPSGQEAQVAGSFGYVQVWHGSFPIENDDRGDVSGNLSLTANGLIEARLKMTILGDASELEIIDSVGTLNYNSSHPKTEGLECKIKAL